MIPFYFTAWKKSFYFVFIFKDGKPSAVILDIKEYRKILERLEDLEDMSLAKEMRKKPLKFRKLEDF